MRGDSQAVALSRQEAGVASREVEADQTKDMLKPWDLMVHGVVYVMIIGIPICTME